MSPLRYKSLDRHAFNPISQEAEIGRSLCFGGQDGLQSVFQDSLTAIQRNKQNNKQTNKNKNDIKATKYFLKTVLSTPERVSLCNILTILELSTLG